METRRKRNIRARSHTARSKRGIQNKFQNTKPLKGVVVFTRDITKTKKNRKIMHIVEQENPNRKVNTLINEYTNI